MKNGHKMVAGLLGAAALSSVAWAAGWQSSGTVPAKAPTKNPVFQQLAASAPAPEPIPEPAPQPPANDGGTSAPTYDYRFYIEGNNVTRKVFATAPRPAVCGDTEVRSFVRTPDAGGTRVTETRVRAFAGVNCSFERMEHLAADSAYLLQRADRYDNNGGVLQASRAVVRPLPLYGSAMAAGVTWGSGSELINNPPTSTEGLVTETSVLLGVASVTVPVGSFNDCLKIEHTRMSNQLGRYTAVSWVCPGVGEVKRIQGADSSMAHWVLTEIETQ